MLNPGQNQLKFSTNTLNGISNGPHEDFDYVSADPKPIIFSENHNKKYNFRFTDANRLELAQKLAKRNLEKWMRQLATKQVEDEDMKSRKAKSIKEPKVTTRDSNVSKVLNPRPHSSSVQFSQNANKKLPESSYSTYSSRKRLMDDRKRSVEENARDSQLRQLTAKLLDYENKLKDMMIQMDEERRRTRNLAYGKSRNLQPRPASSISRYSTPVSAPKQSSGLLKPVKKSIVSSRPQSSLHGDSYLNQPELTDEREMQNVNKIASDNQTEPPDEREQTIRKLLEQLKQTQPSSKEAGRIREPAQQPDAEVKAMLHRLNGFMDQSNEIRKRWPSLKFEKTSNLTDINEWNLPDENSQRLIRNEPRNNQNGLVFSKDNIEKPISKPNFDDNSKKIKLNRLENSTAEKLINQKLVFQDFKDLNRNNSKFQIDMSKIGEWISDDLMGDLIECNAEELNKATEDLIENIVNMELDRN